MHARNANGRSPIHPMQAIAQTAYMRPKQMPVAISIQNDITGALIRFKKLTTKKIETSANRALKRAGDKTYTKFIRDTSKRYSIKSTILRKVIRKTKRINPRMPIYFINANSPKARGNNLIEFVSPSKRNPTAFRARTKGGARSAPRYKHKGVKAKAWGQTKTYGGTFIGKGKNSGKMLVFARTGKGRDAGIKAVTGPSPYRRFLKKRVRNELLRTGLTSFRIEFERLLQLELDRAGLG